MTDCISHLDFGFLSRKALIGNFDGGDISSDGGVMLLAEVDQALGLTAQMAARLEDSRQAGKVRHPLHDLLRQRSTRSPPATKTATMPTGCAAIRS